MASITVTPICPVACSTASITVSTRSRITTASTLVMGSPHFAARGTRCPARSHLALQHALVFRRPESRSARAVPVRRGSPERSTSGSSRSPRPPRLRSAHSAATGRRRAPVLELRRKCCPRRRPGSTAGSTRETGPPRPRLRRAARRRAGDPRGASSSRLPRRGLRSGRSPDRRASHPSRSPRRRPSRRAGAAGARPTVIRRACPSVGLPAPAQLAVVVEGELRGMWAEPYDVRLVLALVVDPGADQVLAEDTAGSQELVVVLERLERFGKRAWHLRDTPVLLEEIPVRRLAGIEALLDPVEPGHQHRREREIGIRRGIGAAELDSLGLR